MHPESVTLVCFAVKEEAKSFNQLAGGRPNIEILLTGMGSSNSANALRTRLTSTRPGLVVSSGFTGGLKPGLATGRVLFSSPQNSAMEQALVKAGAEPARFCFSERIVTSVQDKKRLHEKTGAAAVEMESKIICALCQERQIPCVTVRVVLDTAEEDLPLDFNQLLTPDDRMDFGKLALTLFKHPGKIPALMRLRQQTDLAAKRLAEVLARALLN
jgi:adenosylhomocysteine nucleosidase